MLYNNDKVGVSMVYEKRTVISKEKLDELVNYFDNKAAVSATEKQVIYNYHTEEDLRLIRTNKYVKLDLKSYNGENNKVYITKSQEKDLIEMLFKIGINVDFKRFRIRHQYMYDNYYISIDENIKTGNIFRVKVTYEEDDKLKEVKENVKNLLLSLDIEDTPLDQFQKIYGKYRSDWADLTKDIDEDDFLK